MQELHKQCNNISVICLNRKNFKKFLSFAKLIYNVSHCHCYRKLIKQMFFAFFFFEMRTNGPGGACASCMATTQGVVGIIKGRVQKIFWVWESRLPPLKSLYISCANFTILLKISDPKRFRMGAVHLALPKIDGFKCTFCTHSNVDA